jgi:hypothetical protein
VTQAGQHLPAHRYLGWIEIEGGERDDDDSHGVILVPRAPARGIHDDGTAVYENRQLVVALFVQAP